MVTIFNSYIRKNKTDVTDLFFFSGFIARFVINVSKYLAKISISFGSCYCLQNNISYPLIVHEIRTNI